MTETVDLTKLRTPFLPEYVGKLPRVTCRACSDGRCGEHKKIKCADCGNWISERHIHLDYVGHADVTIRLLEVDPEWSWAPKATDADPELLKAAMASGDAEIVRAVIENAPPKFETDRNGNPVGLWIKLTVGGVTRLGVGSCPSNQNDAEKVLIGDALRNAAMRFGVAVELWAKGDRADPTRENATASAGQASRRGSAQSAADAFENAAPAPGRQNGGSGNGQRRPAPQAAAADGEGGQPAPDAGNPWLNAALKAAPAHATLDACTAMWHKAAEKVKDGTLAKADAARLQAVLRKRMDELKAASPVAAGLDPDDAWAAKVEEIPEGDADAAAAVLEEAARMLSSGELGAEHYARIEAAVEAKFPKAPAEARAA